MYLECTVNGEGHRLEVDARARLLDVLRDKLGLTGTKEGCGEGECGACTIIMNGLAINACLVLAAQANRKEILTVEILEQDGELDGLQKAFIENGAVQCGYCTPGMLMSCKALLMQNPNPNEKEIRRAIEGNLCRCTGYTKIVKAVKEVAEKK
ncbi:xanthine dehydrogenase iron-sulfur binding subunit [Clostridium aceticum]|uniref:Xanthine dehydrogenase iron-sulfur binding subunit n=1 Tax=Clostridium aceticum TaxID=84022 RepID=A0A0D8I7P2_9CLOT|nr:(2Fe-2S)-binding protein [Clostridium aceticum]AKL97284.1 xanthine dehydrogenase iron-sulfur binding subunit [Clostridium aceticum]KJF26305.1 (2Fe-2S)-binding protein [Clostridium aceticum]